jgi:hypothetical protein
LVWEYNRNKYFYVIIISRFIYLSHDGENNIVFHLFLAECVCVLCVYVLNANQKVRVFLFIILLLREMWMRFWLRSALGNWV